MALPAFLNAIMYFIGLGKASRKARQNCLSSSRHSLRKIGLVAFWEFGTGINRVFEYGDRDEE
jgi:hypothetical protein